MLYNLESEYQQLSSCIFKISLIWPQLPSLAMWLSLRSLERALAYIDFTGYPILVL
jgi:hypothetical protein